MKFLRNVRLYLDEAFAKAQSLHVAFFRVHKNNKWFCYGRERLEEKNTERNTQIGRKIRQFLQRIQNSVDIQSNQVCQGYPQVNSALDHLSQACVPMHTVSLHSGNLV